MNELISTRRGALAALAATAAGLAVTATAVHAADPAADVAATVAKLRDAMIGGKAADLDALLSDRLVYVHSDAHFDTKDSLIKSLVGSSAIKTLTFSDQIVDVVGDNAIVRHTYDSDVGQPDGSVKTAHIRVLQVWKLDKGAWRLIARQSTPLKS
jgi:ketosteroid isomerase-like protein